MNLARLRPLACVLGVLVAEACASRAPLPVVSSGRFERVDQILVAPESGSVKIKVRGWGHIVYPIAAAGRGAEAWPVVGYVVDTTGRVELRTMTFFPPTPPAEFQKSICDWAYTVRFTPPLVDGQPRRVFFVQPFTFSRDKNTGSRHVPDVKFVADELRGSPSGVAIARLEPLPHC